MTRTDILEELGKLPADERFDIVETALHQSREQFRAGRLDTAAERRERLSTAADALKTAYETDSELTAFTTIGLDRKFNNEVQHLGGRKAERSYPEWLCTDAIDTCRASSAARSCS